MVDVCAPSTENEISIIIVAKFTGIFELLRAKLTPIYEWKLIAFLWLKYVRFFQYTLVLLNINKFNKLQMP